MVVYWGSTILIFPIYEWRISAVFEQNVYNYFIWGLSYLVSTAMPKRIENAKIACLDFSLQKAKMHLGVSVVVEDPEKLEAIRQR